MRSVRGQLQSAVYAVLGRELALGFTQVSGSGEDMAVTGYVSQPACCRASRNWQFFFVNGRQVKSRLMMAALEEAYKNQKMVGKFPACVLHLELKRSAVDVNVHPAKTEVKFGNERSVFGAVYHAVLAALERDHTRPAAVLERPKPHDTVTPRQTAFQTMPAQQFRTTLAVSDSARPHPRRPVFSDPLRRPEAVVPSAPRPKPSAPPVPAEDTDKSAPLDRITPCQGQVEEAAEPAKQVAHPVENSVEKVENIRAAETISPKPVPERETVSPSPAPPEPEAEPETEPEPEVLPWRLAGEVLNTYIIVEQGDKVLFIDKHAAHERMNFDRMKAAGYDPMAQTLLTPMVCRLDPEEHAALLSHLPLLEEFGFGVEDFGGGALVVRQAPFDVDPGDIEATLTEIAQKLLTTGAADPGAARDELLHTMACKAAIKGGWKTSPRELERVAQAVMSGQVKYCPHGRPVAIELTRQQLEKQFKRS